MVTNTVRLSYNVTNASACAAGLASDHGVYLSGSDVSPAAQTAAVIFLINLIFFFIKDLSVLGQVFVLRRDIIK